MDITQLQAKLERLTAAHKAQTAQEFILSAQGGLNEAEMQRRYDQRIQELAELQAGGAEYERAIEAELAKEERRKRRHRWKRYSEGVWHTKPHVDDPIDYTKAQRAVLVAFMAASRGRRSFTVAYQWVAAKCGASRSTVKRLLKEMQSEGLISITERRISRDRNEWNEYRILSDKLFKWAKRHFFKEGVKNGSDLRTLKGSSTTDSKSSNKYEQKNTCSPEAKHVKKGPPAEALDAETFVSLAQGALSEIGYSQPNDCTEDEILEEIEILRERYQPHFNLHFWNKFKYNHGKRRTALAFLETQILSRIRKDVPDNRPWNERDRIQNKNGYLYGILKQDRNKCRPEISVGALLYTREGYVLPDSLRQTIETHFQNRSGLKRYHNSADQVSMG